MWRHFFSRRDSGVSQAAQIGGLLVASLAIGGGMVVAAPAIGSAVGDLFVCEPADQATCAEQEAAATAGRPTDRRLTETAATGSGVDNPVPVHPWGGGAGLVPGQGWVEFSSCWQSHLDEPVERGGTRQHRTTLCRAAAGTSYTCDEGWTYRAVFGWTDWRGRVCRPTDGTGVPEGLAACVRNAAGTEHCDNQELQSVLPAGRRPDRFEVWSDPSVEDADYGGWQVGDTRLENREDVLANCTGAENAACNATVTAALRDVSGRFGRLHQRLERCKQALGVPPTAQLHVVGSGEFPHAYVKVGAGWLDTADLPDDPAARAAAVHVLQYAASEQAKKAADARSAGQVAAMIGYTRAMTGALDQLEAGAAGLAGVGCGAAARALADLAAPPALGETAGYSDDCVATDAAGACTEWRAQELIDQGTVDGTTTADVGAGVTLTLSRLARDNAAPGLVPGDPTAGYDETVVWCGTNPESCRAQLRQRAERTAGQATATLRRLGICTTPVSCAAVADRFVAGTADAGCPQGWTIGRYTVALGNSGIVACGIIGGGLLGYGVGQWLSNPIAGSVVGSLLTAIAVTKGNIFATLAAPALATLAQFDVEAQQSLHDRQALDALRRVVRELPGFAAAAAEVAGQDAAAQAVGDLFGRLYDEEHNA